MLPERRKCRLLCVALCIVFAAAQNGEQADQVRRPPSIIQGPASKHVPFKEDSDIELTCRTSGVPVPTVKWIKNSKVINPDEFTEIRSDGSLMLKKVTSREEGYYQCVAENSYGKSVSDTVYIQFARTDVESNQTPYLYSVKEWQPLQVKCKNAVVVPEDKAQYHWTVAATVEGNGYKVNLDKRVSVDKKGNLYFAYTKQEDHKNGQIYKCQVRNAVRDATLAGSYSKINVDPSAEVQSPPTVAFPSGSDVIQVALKGDVEVHLKCLFSGNPAPSIKWEKVGGNLPAGRHRYQDRTNQVLIIDHVKLEDEGDYKCTGFQETTIGESQTIKLKVDELPTFKTGNRPINMNVTQDDNAVFKCITDAIPKASVQWYKNGDAISGGDHIVISEDGTLLTVKNVQKPKDLMVVQCNASNYHGYQFVDAYLNVLLKTEFTIIPVDKDVEANVTEVMFHAEATSDISTPVTYSWEYEQNPINYESGVIEMLPNHTLWINFTGMAYEDKGKYIGMYRVTITNGYDKDFREARLFIQNVPTAAPVIIVEGSGFALWWVILLIALLLLLLLLLLCCCLWCQRNRGDAYPVDEKERANGNDPEKELADDGYKDYVRPEDEPVKGSRASLNSSIKLDSDDEGSLNEYGDIDTGKFNEDGSFIGLYGTDKKKKDTAPPPYKPNDSTV